MVTQALCLRSSEAEFLKGFVISIGKQKCYAAHWFLPLQLFLRKTQSVRKAELKGLSVAGMLRLEIWFSTSMPEVLCGLP
jgi:hypothetical protein